MLAGFIVYAPYAFLFLDRRQEQLFLITCLFVWISVEILRFRYGKFNAWLLRYFGFCFKQEEHHRLTSVGYFLTGVLAAISFFPPWISHIAVLCLVFGDPAAYFSGKILGKRYLRNGKSWEGFWGCVLICSALASLVLNYFGEPWWYCFVAGLTAAFFELNSNEKFDDNLLITAGVAVSLSVANWLMVTL